MDKRELLLKALNNATGRLKEFKKAAVSGGDIQDISLTGYHYLEMLSSMDNPTFVDLTRRMGVSKPTVTIMVNKLIDKGYLKKTQSEADRRVYYISFTEKGKKVVKAFQEAHAQFVNYVSSRFNDEELDTLISLLGKI